MEPESGPGLKVFARVQVNVVSEDRFHYTEYISAHDTINRSRMAYVGLFFPYFQYFM